MPFLWRGLALSQDRRYFFFFCLPEAGFVFAFFCGLAPGAGLPDFAGGFADSFCLVVGAGGLADGACCTGFLGTPFAEGATGACSGTGAAAVATANAFGLRPRFFGPCSVPASGAA